MTTVIETTVSGLVRDTICVPYTRGSVTSFCSRVTTLVRAAKVSFPRTRRSRLTETIKIYINFICFGASRSSTK